MDILLHLLAHGDIADVDTIIMESCGTELTKQKSICKRYCRLDDLGDVSLATFLPP